MKKLNGMPFLLVLSIGCGSTGTERPETEAQTEASARPVESGPTGPTGSPAQERAQALLAPKIWTDAFASQAMLLADRIRIEGPAGLLDHVVVRSDDALFLRTTEARSDGFLQRTVPRQSNQASTDQTYLVRGQLDAWQFTAIEEVVVFERPGDVPVTLIAEGHVVWRDRDGAQRREDRIVFTGTLGPVATPSAASAERE